MLKMAANRYFLKIKVSATFQHTNDTSTLVPCFDTDGGLFDAIFILREGIRRVELTLDLI